MAEEDGIGALIRTVCTDLYGLVGNPATVSCEGGFIREAPIK
jgi:hypothetical protein